jgi:hypothetical protein
MDLNNILQNYKVTTDDSNPDEMHINFSKKVQVVNVDN